MYIGKRDRLGPILGYPMTVKGFKRGRRLANSHLDVCRVVQTIMDNSSGYRRFVLCPLERQAPAP